MKYTLYIGTKEYSLSTEEDILKIYPSELSENYKMLVGTEDIIGDIQKTYRKLFEKATKKYNQEHPGEKIDYYAKINESKKQSLATGILIKLGKKENITMLSTGHKRKIQKLFKQQLILLQKKLPFYELVHATLDFSVPCLRLIGIPWIKEENASFLVRVSKGNSFSREKIKELREILHEQAEQDFYNLFFSNQEKEKKKKVKNKRIFTEDDYEQLVLF